MRGPAPCSDGDVLEHAVEVAWERLDEEVVVMRDTEAALFVLDAPAAATWSRCDGTATLAQIVHDLATEFRADAAIVRRDVAALAADLVDRGLLVHRGDRR